MTADVFCQQKLLQVKRVATYCKIHSLFFLWFNIQILFSLFLKIFELKLNALIVLYEEFNCFQDFCMIDRVCHDVVYFCDKITHFDLRYFPWKLSGLYLVQLNRQ